VRNIFLFIRHYFNFIFFLFLQVLCISIIVHYSTYHSALASSYMNQVTGKVNAQYNKIEYYFQLTKTNDSLVKENERLYNKLRADFQIPDNTNRRVIDTLRVDSIETYRMYNYLEAKVVYNSIALPNNYIELARGSLNGMKKDCGIIDINRNVVGIVTDVSDQYAVVLSMLHKDENSRISAKLKKGGELGEISWDGNDPGILLLKEIRKSAKVAIGDTVVTSGITATFPYGLIIGTVVQVTPDESTNSVVIKLRSAANFNNLEYVYAIDNLQKDAMDKLLQKASKQNQ
jgi:rod shape-determining protein MreC